MAVCLAVVTMPEYLSIRYRNFLALLPLMMMEEKGEVVLVEEEEDAAEWLSLSAI